MYNRNWIIWVCIILMMSLLPLTSAFAEDTAEISWDYEADVVVIGAGGSGLPAALKAMEDGASVILVETNYDTGGHAVTSGGNLHNGAGTEFQKNMVFVTPQICTITIIPAAFSMYRSIMTGKSFAPWRTP